MMSLKRWIFVLLIAGFWVAGAYLVAWIAKDSSQTSALAKLNAQNRELALILSNELNRIRVQLPPLHNAFLVKRALLQPERENIKSLNRYLKEQSFAARADRIFVTDATGDVIASSNYDEQLEFVGSSMANQPYFQQAALNQRSEYYEVDYLLENRGYLFSFPVLSEGNVVGVIAVRYPLRELYFELSRNDNVNFLVGVDGVIFASSDPVLDFKAITPIAPDMRSWLRDSERYGAAELRPISEYSRGDFFDLQELSIRFNGRANKYLVSSYPVQNSSWILFSALSSRTLLASVVWALLFYLCFSGLILLLWLYLRKRNEMQVHLAHMNEQLEQRVEDLTSGLKRSNNELTKLVDHYQTTQEKLEQTQYELLQTARLAALGELSATLNHEMSQPALALRAYTDNSLKLLERGDYATVQQNFGEMRSICDSMAGIVNTIKTFARQTAPEMREVAIGDIIQSTMPIVNHLIQQQSVVLHTPSQYLDTRVRCVPEQIEQVLINLISNAVDATGGKPEAQVWITLDSSPNALKIGVRNNHSTVKRGQLKKLFDPFYTTKKEGLGIGLALCKRIVEAQDGKIVARICRNQDIEFIVTLNRRRDR